MKTLRIIIAALILITAITSCMAQDVTTGTHYKFKNGITSDSINAEDSLIIDGAAILKFRSVAAGEKTLAELAAGGGYWSKSGTDLSPTNAGDDVLMPTGDKVTFRSLANSINSSAPGRLSFTAGSNSAAEFTSSAFNISVSGWMTTYGVGIANHTNHDGYLGNTTAFWQRLYADTVYIYDTNTKIYRDSSNNLTIEDANAGPKTLAELAAGGSSYTFENGLTESGGVVKLGGALTGKTTITGSDSDTIILQDNYASQFISARQYFSANGINFKAWDDAGYTGNDRTEIKAASSNIGLYKYNASGSVMRMSIGDYTFIELRDDINNTGAKYYADYSANYTDRSLVDKEYVDTKGGAMITMYAASIGRGLVGDSAQFQTGATYQRIWNSGPDTIQVDTCRVVCDDGDAPNFTYNIIWQQWRIDGAWTNLWTTAPTVSGADAITTGVITSTFTNPKIPPNSYIEMIFETLTTKPTSVSLNLIGHYIR